jgi:hypothetical protein
MSQDEQAVVILALGSALTHGVFSFQEEKTAKALLKTLTQNISVETSKTGK